MKLITPYLLKFALATLVFTLVFRYVLSTSLQHQLFPVVIASSVIYGILMFISGWFYGKKDSDYLPIFDVGFRFHLTTYLVHNGVSLLWLGMGFGSTNESIRVVVWVAAYWSVFLLIHFIIFLWAKKRSINNLSKEDLFD